MSITVKKIALPEQQIQAGNNVLLKDNYLSLVGSVEVECQIRLGTATMTIAELGRLQQGQTVQLKQKTSEPIEILLNNQVIARGELLCAEECFALQITEVSS
ncbi:Flagellar motor switch protein FliN [Legionella massiliensis]|uniref:Flagellar motor switch protein FliN n=1 Tax=Legionella massiliensis TaxID=1034943 RepID=A0A078KVM2_9GAMM|nr:FliM/FliN family flagellar motor switch protein [Legionella massiliensis]CDZ77052.1 Flagellar motor switch protein FliN [Legionella massiliensis]CEE12790.1 Flagellar motor switch protein FliN [Legionella massiliensis]